ncbi:MAG: FprA family A-type flavoprotein [Deltaproteobacteria bacterium]|nr:FprA family A-type flavoprotein [Deltaproteobacteria bacterium]
MAQGLIVYASRSGNTEDIANLIAEGMRIEGVQTLVKEVSQIKTEADLEDYEALLIGSPTYHGEMIQSVKTLLFLAEKANLKGKVGGSFGAYGWSGEAAERIYGTMEHVLKMDMVSGPLMLKSASLGGGLQMAQDYGRQVAKKLNA